MKNTKKIFAGTLVLLLNISSVLASGIPEEPMVIYGNIEGVENGVLNINNNGNLIQTTDFSNNTYGTSKTFDINNKIIVNNFDGELSFDINGYNLESIQKGETSYCNSELNFQTGNICQYNITFNSEQSSSDDSINDNQTTDFFNNIYDGKTLEETKNIIEPVVGDNLLANIDTLENIMVQSSELIIEKTIAKETLIISENKKEAIHIPKDTKITQENVIIQKPIKIENTSAIRNKINKTILGAVNIPTNKEVNFDKKVRICSNVSKNTNIGLNVYYSNDGINWTKDTNISNLIVKNYQACFDINHLTSFAITEDTTSSSSTGGGGTGWGGGKSSSSSSTNNENIEEKILENIKTIKKVDNINTIEIKDYSDIKISSKDYATSLKTYIKNKKEIKNTFGLNVAYIKGDSEYNKIVNSMVKEIYKDIKIPGIRKTMLKYVDKMTMSYGISIDEEIDSKLRETFKNKLVLDIKNVEKKLKVSKTKDYIINKTLEKRKLKELNSKKENINLETNNRTEQENNNLIINEKSINYSIAVGSIKLSIDNEFKNSHGVLYFGEKVEQISRTTYFVKVKVLDSKDGLNGKIGYISRKYLREIK